MNSPVPSQLFRAAERFRTDPRSAKLLLQFGGGSKPRRGGGVGP